MDHYTTLGVAKTATQDEIKKAFRKLASQHHPDKGGDTAKFQEIQAAYDTLGDADKRAQYDNPAPQFGGFPGGGFRDGSVNINDIFNMFGQGGFGGFPGGQHPRRGHARITLHVTIRDIAVGGSKPVAIGSASGQNTVEIDIPLGLNDGDSVQYQGIAPGGQDLVVTFRIRPDPLWERDALNLTLTQDVVIWDLVLGGDLTVRNILGDTLTIRIPAKTQPGTKLRLRGQGLRDRRGQTGDMFVRLNARLPQTISEDLVEAIQKYR